VSFLSNSNLIFIMQLEKQAQQKQQKISMKQQLAAVPGVRILK